MLRKIARAVCWGWTIRRRFYHGQIGLDAVDHS
jgi:hypothetical protein